MWKPIVCDASTSNTSVAWVFLKSELKLKLDIAIKIAATLNDNIAMKVKNNEKNERQTSQTPT